MKRIKSWLPVWFLLALSSPTALHAAPPTTTTSKPAAHHATRRHRTHHAAKKAKAATTASDGPKVWLNSKTGIYHYPGSRWYGATAEGRYMSEAEARKEGDRPAANNQ